MKIVISSGHGKYVRGASGYLDEVDEARRVVDRTAELVGGAGVKVEVFHDDVSHSQNENLNRIVNFHNGETRELDVSVHFNAYETTGAPMGCECLYVTQDALAQKVATEICGASGLKNRGPKKRTDLFFLNNTEEPAILIETCFVDSRVDADLYEENFEAICAAIAETISGVELAPAPPDVTEPGLPVLPQTPSRLVTIDVPIYQSYGGGYVCFISDLDICNDGSGPSHGDPHHSSETAYYNGGKFLNADVDHYLVIPPQVRSLLPAKVMGCLGRLTHLKSGVWSGGVVGEIGPDDKTGEAAFCLAKIVNPAVTHNSGDKSRIYLYEFWPGIAADGYELES